LIIGLAGYAQSGKDTVAKVLIEKHGFTKIAFAEMIRVALYRLNPLIKDGVRLADYVDQLGWDGAKQEPEVRRLLQVFGTEVGRSLLGDNVWVDLALAGIKPGVNYVFTDVRFESEALAIKNLGGQVWRVSREGVYSVNGHSSESALEGFDFDARVSNDGTIAELELLIDKISQGWI
jgi:hypothetical protein